MRRYDEGVLGRKILKPSVKTTTETKTTGTTKVLNSDGTVNETETDKANFDYAAYLKANPDVQAELDKGLSIVLNAKIETMGCGRTDSGVHASMFFAHFDSEKLIEDHSKIIKSLDLILPKDINVDRLILVENNAHARFDATTRTYHYFLNRHKNPFIHETSTRIYYDLNLELMNDATEILTRYDDFSCFSKSNTQTKTNLCKIYEANWIVFGKDNLRFEIKANRFLRNMVRAIVGTMILVGQKKITIEEFEEIILSKSRTKAGKSVDACGLFLVEVTYPYIETIGFH
jgi:tRNA pseudouridine38-40 synthase